MNAVRKKEKYVTAYRDRRIQVYETDKLGDIIRPSLFSTLTGARTKWLTEAVATLNEIKATPEETEQVLQVLDTARRLPNLFIKSWIKGGR